MRTRRVAVALCLILLAPFAPAQDAAKKEAATAADQWEEVQREVGRLRAAGLTNEADALEKQVRATLGQVLLRHRQQQALRSRRRDPAAQAIATTKALIEDVRTEISDDEADPLIKRLAAIEMQLATGTLDSSEGVEPELHAIQVDMGTTLPAEFAEGRDRQAVGYVEVELDYADRPIVLVLTGRRQTLWNIKMGDAKLHAILRNSSNQQVIGAGDCPILEGAAATVGVLASTRRAFWEATGRVTATSQYFEFYDGNPIVIGRRNRTWLSSYFSPSVEEIRDDAEAMLTRHRVGELADVRFSAVHRVSNNRDLPRGDATSQGEFTIAGPVANSLVPLPRTLGTGIIEVPGENPKRFALSHQGTLMVADAGSMAFMPIPVAAAVNPAGSFTAICLDTRRNRLVLAGQSAGAFCAYEVATQKWKKLAPLKATIDAIAYYPPDDALYAIPTYSRYVSGQAASPRLLRLTLEGEVVSESALKFAADDDGDAVIPGPPVPRPYGESRVQLVAAGNKLAALLRSDQTSKPLKLIDPQTLKVIYEGAVRAHHDEDPAQVLTRPLTQPPMQVFGLLPRVDRSFAEAARVLRHLSEQDANAAKQFANSVQEVRDVMRGRIAKRDYKQAYFVSQFATSQKQPVRVNFSDTGGPSVLHLTTSLRRGQQTSIAWDVHVAEGTQLREVVLSNENDTVEGLPDGVKVSMMDAGLQMQQMAKAIRIQPTLVGGRETSVTIGPASGQWRCETALVALRRLIDESGVDLQSPELAELGKQRFFAVARGRGNEPSYYAEFTVRGPIIGTELDIKIDSRDQVLGAAKDRVYIWQRGRGFDGKIVEINLETGAHEELKAPQMRLGIRSPSCSVDARNQRLYLSDRDGIKLLDLKTHQWTAANSGRRGGFGDSLIAYSPAKDMLYDLTQQHGRGGGVKRYNHRGALLDLVPIRENHFPHRPGGVQTASFGRYVAQVHYVNGHGTIQVIDLETGDTVHQGKLQRHLPRREVSRDELAEMYEVVGTRDTKVDRMMWEMAAGHNATVAFLDPQFVAPTPVEIDIQPLVKQLSGEEFADREAAFKKLQKHGSAIEPEVRKALRADLPVETRARLRRLVDAWESAEPRTGPELQRVRAITVLERIGSSAAKSVLREIAGGRGDPIARRAAAQALGRLN